MAVWSLNGRNYTDAAGDDVTLFGMGGGKHAKWWGQMMTDLAAQTALANKTTSTSSNSIGSGNKTFALAADINLPVGTLVCCAVTASPGTNYMYGQVTAYTGGGSPSVTVAIISVLFFGSGTYTAWTIGGVGPRGASGAGFPAITAPDANKAAIVNGAGSAAVLDWINLRYAKTDAATP
ncbi:MAG: hypothetical protein ABL951_16900, partial [Alphaproteobacteria bacterium]